MPSGSVCWLYTLRLKYRNIDYLAVFLAHGLFVAFAFSIFWFDNYNYCDTFSYYL